MAYKLKKQKSMGEPWYGIKMRVCKTLNLVATKKVVIYPRCIPITSSR